jgi:HD domain
MKKITDIYRDYKTMPNLQLHQLRVAAVAKQICDSLDVPTDCDLIVTACLLHDMGNIIKFKLGYFPEFLEPEGLEYWKNVQDEYIKKYGHDEHHATLAITRELFGDKNISEIIDAVGFHNWSSTHENGTWNQKICTYADTRVAPYGVASLEERIEDAARRYRSTSTTSETKRLSLYDSVRQIEKEIFAHSSIKPSDVTDESVKNIVEELKDFSCDIQI